MEKVVQFGAIASVSGWEEFGKVWTYVSKKISRIYLMYGLIFAFDLLEPWEQQLVNVLVTITVAIFLTAVWTIFIPFVVGVVQPFLIS